MTGRSSTTPDSLSASGAKFTPADSGAVVSGAGIQLGTTINTWNPLLDSSTLVHVSPSTTTAATNVTVTVSLTQNWVVTYWDVPYGSTYQLVRMFCALKASGLTFISKAVVAHDLPANQGPATITCGPTIAATSCTPSYLANHWVSTAGISSIGLSATEPASGYAFNLSASPRNSNPASEGSPAGSPTASTLLLTGSGPSYISLPSGSDTMTVNGSLELNGPSGYVGGSGTLNDAAGPISIYNCPTSPSPNCSHFTPPAQFNGTCNCAQPTTTGNLGVPPNVSPPASPTPASPQGHCNTSGGTTTCTPGYYPNPVNVSGNVTFASGNYLFAASVAVTAGSSVNFGNGQYTFDNGLNASPNVTITGGGVFFYFAGTSASLNVSTGDTVALTPAISGPYLGVLVYQPQSNASPMFLGSTSTSVNSFGGAIEAPGAPVTIGTNGDNLKVGSLIASSVSLGSSSVTVTIGS